MFTRAYERIKEIFDRFEAKNSTELPADLQTGLSNYLTPGEDVLITLKNYRAIYKAKRWSDSNTFFNSWFILTNLRILILRNSSSFKMFRDIPLEVIRETNYELDRLEPRIKFSSHDGEDIIEFSKRSMNYCKEIENKVKDALANVTIVQKDSPDSETIYCNNCGTRILRHSNFCFRCGTKL